jgi:hypothetical protein
MKRDTKIDVPVVLKVGLDTANFRAARVQKAAFRRADAMRGGGFPADSADL